MNSVMRASAAAAISVLLLAGCQSAKDKAMCPGVAVLANTSVFTKFKPGMDGDPAGELFTVQMTRAEANCSFDLDEGTTDSDIDITFRATRPPSGEQDNFTAPFYVASVLDGKTILTKSIKAVAFSFAPGESTVTFTQNVPSFPNRMQNGIKPYQYSLVVGLQLTREQLNYLKNIGHLAP